MPTNNYSHQVPHLNIPWKSVNWWSGEGRWQINILTFEPQNRIEGVMKGAAQVAELLWLKSDYGSKLH